jgi:hypothetical protein
MIARAFRLGFCLILAALMPSLVQAQAPAASIPGAVTMYAPSTVNIRAGAGKNYPIIGKVIAGHAVQVVLAPPSTHAWYQLTTGGFVSARLLAPAVPAPVAPTPQPGGVVVQPAPVVVEPAPVYVAPYYYGPHHPYYRHYPY